MIQVLDLDFSLLNFSILISLVTFFFFIKFIFVIINRLFLMDLDKSWIDLPRNTQQYMDGLNKFLDFAFANKSVEGKIICPCPKCNLNKWQTRGATYEHFTRLIHIGDNDDDEPYIQAVEAQIVYYVMDELDKNWSILVHLKPRDLYDIGGDNDVTFHECEPFEQQNLETLFPDGEGNIPLTRSY